MTPSLQKMWVSFIGIGFMIFSLLAIYLARYKFEGVLKGLAVVVAYMFMIFAGLIIFIVVMSGPTNG